MIRQKVLKRFDNGSGRTHSHSGSIDLQVNDSIPECYHQKVYFYNIMF